MNASKDDSASNSARGGVSVSWVDMIVDMAEEYQTYMSEKTNGEERVWTSAAQAWEGAKKHFGRLYQIWDGACVLPDSLDRSIGSLSGCDLWRGGRVPEILRASRIPTASDLCCGIVLRSIAHIRGSARSCRAWRCQGLLPGEDVVAHRRGKILAETLERSISVKLARGWEERARSSMIPCRVFLLVHALFYRAVHTETFARNQPGNGGSLSANREQAQTRRRLEEGPQSAG